MQSNDSGQFKAALQKVFALYDKNLSTVLLEVWWDALQPYALADVTRALTAHVRNPDSGQFLPKPADVIKGITGGSANSSHQAWTKVDSAVRRKGPYVSVAFDDPIIHRVIADMGGWIRMCSHDNESWPFVQKEFESRYRGFSAQGGVTEYPSKLIGIAEDQNSREGVRMSLELQHKTNAVALIGDASKAEAVLSGGSKGAIVQITSRLTHDASEQAGRQGSARSSAGIMRIVEKAKA